MQSSLTDDYEARLVEASSKSPSWGLLYCFSISRCPSQPLRMFGPESGKVSWQRWELEIDEDSKVSKDSIIIHYLLKNVELVIKLDLILRCWNSSMRSLLPLLYSYLMKRLNHR